VTSRQKQQALGVDYYFANGSLARMRITAVCECFFVPTKHVTQATLHEPLAVREKEFTAKVTICRLLSLSSIHACGTACLPH